MSSRRYPPAYFRYLKARLLNFTRPVFWGTAIFLSITGLAIREIATKPDLLTSFRRNQVAEETNSRLSPEERAIAADIDNLPVLFFDFEQAVLPKVNIAEKSKNQSVSSPKIELKKQGTQTKLVSGNTIKANNFKIDNPFLKKAENLLKLELSSTGQTESTNTQVGISNTFNSNQSSSPINPLQAQLNPSSYPQYSNITGNAVPQTALELAINQSRQTNQNRLNQATQITSSPVFVNTNPTVNANINNQNYNYSSAYSPTLSQNTNLGNTNNQTYYPTPTTPANQNQSPQQIYPTSNYAASGYYTNTYPQINQANPVNNPSDNLKEENSPSQPTINYAPMPIGR